MPEKGQSLPPIFTMPLAHGMTELTSIRRHKMVAQTCNKIVGRMIANDLISDADRAIYSYHLQIMLETIIVHAILLSMAAITGHFIEIFLFLLGRYG